MLTLSLGCALWAACHLAYCLDTNFSEEILLVFLQSHSTWIVMEHHQNSFIRKEGKLYTYLIIGEVLLTNTKKIWNTSKITHRDIQKYYQWINIISIH